MRPVQESAARYSGVLAQAVGGILRLAEVVGVLPAGEEVSPETLHDWSLAGHPLPNRIERAWHARLGARTNLLDLIMQKADAANVHAVQTAIRAVETKVDEKEPPTPPLPADMQPVPKGGAAAQPAPPPLQRPREEFSAEPARFDYPRIEVSGRYPPWEAERTRAPEPRERQRPQTAGFHREFRSPLLRRVREERMRNEEDAMLFPQGSHVPRPFDERRAPPDRRARPMSAR